MNSTVLSPSVCLRASWWCAVAGPGHSRVGLQLQIVVLTSRTILTPRPWWSSTLPYSPVDSGRRQSPFDTPSTAFDFDVLGAKSPQPISNRMKSIIVIMQNPARNAKRFSKVPDSSMLLYSLCYLCLLKPAHQPHSFQATHLRQIRRALALATVRQARTRLVLQGWIWVRVGCAYFIFVEPGNL